MVIDAIVFIYFNCNTLHRVVLGTIRIN